MPEPVYILLADDDEDDRQFFKDALTASKMDTVIVTVNDGVELMEFLQQAETRLPDIIFLDLNMPRKGGIECLAEIRKSPKLKQLSVAIYSTSSAEKDIDETFLRGANIYIRKPNNFQALKKALAEVLGINWQYRASGMNRDTYMLVV